MHLSYKKLQKETLCNIQLSSLTFLVKYPNKHNHQFNVKAILKKKSNTCKEGKADLRISVWHLLMKLKNNYSLKKC